MSESHSKTESVINALTASSGQLAQLTVTGSAKVRIVMPTNMPPLAWLGNWSEAMKFSVWQHMCAYVSCFTDTCFTGHMYTHVLLSRTNAVRCADLVFQRHICLHTDMLG